MAFPPRKTLAKVTCSVDSNDSVELVFGESAAGAPYVTLYVTMLNPEPDENGVAQRHVVLRSQDITTLIKALHQAHEQIS